MAGRRGRRGGRPDRDAAGGRGINHCASVQQLRLVDGTDAMPLVRENATNPVVEWALDTYGVLPYCWSTGSSTSRSCSGWRTS